MPSQSKARPIFTLTRHWLPWKLGKHVYLAKPVEVDVPGCRKILEAGDRAKGKLSFYVDFQTRVNPFFMEAARRVHEGALGKIVSGQVYYQAGRLRPQADPADHSDAARLRNWVFDIALSGDIIVEQNVHVLDVANWFLGSRPVKAFGTGGRKARVDVGDCWDHFVVTYWYPDDVRISFSSGQYLKGFDDLCTRIFGSEGTVDAHYDGPVSIKGTNPYIPTIAAPSPRNCSEWPRPASFLNALAWRAGSQT